MKQLIQTDLKSCKRTLRSLETLLESSSKVSKNFKNFNLRIQKEFIKIILRSLGVFLESSSKALWNLKNSKSSKIHRIQTPKFQRTSITNFWRSRTFDERLKIIENMKEHLPKKKIWKNKEFLTSLKPKIHHNSMPKIFQSTLQSKCRHFVFESWQFLNWRFFQECRIRGLLFCNRI